jgi:hypothetical protein
MWLLKFVFILFPVLCIGQSEPVRIKSAADESSKTTLPQYKKPLPDSTKFSISRKQLKSFCHAMNLSPTDSLESNPEKIWLGLTDPLAYDKKYKWARQMQLWEEHDSPFPAGWALSNEKEYVQRILLEGFFNPYIYALEVRDLNKEYEYLDKDIKTLSAFERLKESGVLISPWSTKGLKAIEAFSLLNDSLNRYGYSLLILHPNAAPKKGGYTQIQYSYFNVISVRKGFETEVIAIYKLLGLKAEPVSTSSPTSLRRSVSH